MIFEERKTPTQNIAFVALLSGINAVLTIVGAFFPLSFIVTALVITAVNAVATRLIKDSYIALLFFGSLALMIGFGFFNLSDTLFYAVPSLTSGVIFGYLSKKKLPLSLVIFISSLFFLLFTYLALIIVNLVFSFDIIGRTLTLIGLGNKEHARDIVPIFLYGYSLLSITASSFLILELKKRLHDESVKELPLVNEIFTIVLGGMSFALINVNVTASYLFLAFTLYFSSLSCPDLLRKRTIPYYIVVVIMFFGMLYLTAVIYPLIPEPYQLLSCSMIFFAIPITDLLFSLINIIKKKAKGKFGK